MSPRQSAPTLGLRVVETARSQLGVHEVGDNGGLAVAKYLAPCVREGRPLGLRGGVPWCAAFASWCVWEAARWVSSTDAIAWSATDPQPEPPIGYRAAVHELVADARATGTLRLPPTAALPLPGDLLIFGRAGQNPLRGGLGHVATCERWDADGWSLISGNDEDEVRERAGTHDDLFPWGPLLAWIDLGG